MDTTIVDTHTHVVAADQQRYPLCPPEGLPRLSWFETHPVDAAGLLAEMDRAGVHGAVLVQAKGAYGFDNAYAADARALAPSRLANASIVDLQAADRLDQLTYWARDRGMLATRLFDIPPADPPWLDDPATKPVLARAAALGIRITVCLLVEQVPRLGSLCAMAPELAITLDHCGFADYSRPDGPGVGDLEALAVHPNLRLKVTTTFLEPAIAAGVDPRDVVERLCEVFGVSRLAWGSDYPQHHREPYPEIVEQGRYLCSRLSGDEQRRFLGGTALELFPEMAPATVS